MGHALLNGVYDWQQGPRGDTKTFVSGIFMGMANRHFKSGDTIQFRAMLSPEPLIGKSGYPLLFATGETENGTTPLVDRQHPHDLCIELSGTYSHALAPADSPFLYAGLPGEPALGPEGSRFRGREPNQFRYNIEHGALVSTSARISFNPTHAWSLQASWANQVSPEQQQSDNNEKRLSANAIYTHQLGDQTWWSATIAGGARTRYGQ